MPEKKAAKPKPEVEVYDVSALRGKNGRTFSQLWGMTDIAMASRNPAMASTPRYVLGASSRHENAWNDGLAELGRKPV
jgi:hypothetical protein